MAYWKATSSLQDETKQLLRSIIESAPYRIYTRDVEREFSKLMGYELPFRKLGYATCEEYLQSIPDTLSISPTASGPLVRSIAISETKHIGRLVMTQKNNPGRCRQPRKGCAIEYPQLTIGNLRQQQPTKALTDCSESQPVVRRPPLPPNPYCGAHIRGSFTYGSARNDYKTYSNLQGLSIPASAQYAAHNQNVYSIIKTNIVQLLMFYPKGLKIEDFNTSFQSMFNMPLCPNRFGYQTVVEMLVDMPDVVVLRNTGRCLLAFLKQMPTPYYNYQVMPPPLCSANWGYPKPRVPAPQKLERNSQVDQPIQPVTTNNDTTKSQFVQNLEDCKKVIDEQKTCRDISQHSSRSSPNHDHSDVSKGIPEKRPDEEKSNEQQEMTVNTNASSHIGDKMKAVFVQILQQNPAGVLLSSLISEYQKMTNHRLDYREFGYYSVLELVVSLPDIFSPRELEDRGEFILLPAQNKSDDCGDPLHRSDACEIPCESSKIRVAISEELERKLMQVICSCPGGVILDDFETIYSNFHDEEFNFDTLNYTPEAFFLALPHIVTLDYKDDWTIVVRPTPEGEKILGHPNTRSDLSHFLPLDVPTDAVISSSIKFLAQELPNITSEEKYIELYVPYIVNPGKFWIQLRGMKTSIELDKLMRQLKETYYSVVVSKKYAIPPHLIRVGQVCAALYPGDQNWHRAVIENVGDDDEEVEVYYVDFGNCGFISRNDIRLLRMKFMELPGQAIAARLAGIVPYRGNIWTAEAVGRFRELCLDRPLFGSVTSKKDSCLSLCLYDTSGETDIAVNDTLIAECHATLNYLQQPMVQARLALSRTTDFRSSKCSNATQIEASPIDVQPIKTLTTIPKPLNVDCKIVTLGESFPTRCEITSSMQTSSNAKCWSITRTTFAERKFHLVSYSGHVYVPSFEISSLFWSYDSLFQMLVVLKIKVDYVYVRKAANPQLFQSLSQAFLRSKCISCPTLTSIMLCPITKVPEILAAVTDEETDLMTSFKELILQKT